MADDKFPAFLRKPPPMRLVYVGWFGIYERLVDSDVLARFQQEQERRDDRPSRPARRKRRCWHGLSARWRRL